MKIFYIILSLIFLNITFWKPKWSGLIILATLPSYLLRLEIVSIPTTVLELNIYVWFLITLYQIIKNKNLNYFKNILNNKIIFLFLIFIGIGLLSTLVAADMRLALGAWKGWMLDPFLFLLTTLFHYDFFSNQVNKQALIYATMVTVGLVAIWGLVEYIGKFGMQLPGFLNAMFTSANYVALLIIPLWFLFVGLWLEDLNKNNGFRQAKRPIVALAKAGGWIIFHLIVLVTILLTKSYAGLLALGVGSLYILIVLPKTFKYKKIFIILAAIFAIILVCLIVTSNKFSNLININNITEIYDTEVNLPQVGSYNSLQTRQQIWTVTVELIKAHPWLGIGFGNFEPEYYNKAFALYHPPLEWEVPRAHNLFLHTWVELGIFGLIIFVILLIQILIILNKSLKKSENYFIKIGIISAVLSIIIHGLLDTPYYKNDLSIVFVLLLLFTIWENQKIVQ